MTASTAAQEHNTFDEMQPSCATEDAKEYGSTERHEETTMRLDRNEQYEIGAATRSRSTSAISFDRSIQITSDQANALNKTSILAWGKQGPDPLTETCRRLVQVGSVRQVTGALQDAYYMFYVRPQLRPSLSSVTHRQSFSFHAFRMTLHLESSYSAAGGVINIVFPGSSMTVAVAGFFSNDVKYLIDTLACVANFGSVFARPSRARNRK